METGLVIFVILTAAGLVIFAVLAIAGGIAFIVQRGRINRLSCELKESNETCIEFAQTHEQQEFLMETVDYMMFSLLGMHDGDFQQFNNHLVNGMNTVSVVGEVDAIRVFRNMPERSYKLQLAWESSSVSDGTERVFAYAPGWYEKLSEMHVINSAVSGLPEMSPAFTRSKSVLIVPVYFCEEFWGMVWYEDFTRDEPFSLRRVSLLRSASMMIVSAVHRRQQASRIRVVTRSMKIMLDAMPVGCFIWDAGKKIIDANAMSLQFFNFKNISELKSRFGETSPKFQPDGQPSSELMARFLNRAFEKGSAEFEWTYRVPDTDEPLPAEVVFIRMDYDDEYVVAAYIHDVREHKRMVSEIERRGRLLKANEEKLIAALEGAQAASNAKSTFLSTMSHEIRTPMNAIIGMTTLGRGAASEENKDAAFDKISIASKHLLGIINDILDMSKIEAAMFTLSEVAFDFPKMINDVVSVNRFLIEQKGQIFSLRLDTQIPEVLLADNHRLTQVLTNLLSNASKFTADGKEICLCAALESATAESCVLRFDIIDQGIGLTEEQQENLFKSFVQAEASTARKYGGTGLGLSISKHIVELMGGEIRVKSELGKGSTFSFTIEAKIPDIEMYAEECTVGAPIDAEFPGRCLLLAEDIDINREIVLAILEDTKIEIVIARDGEEAYQIFAQNPERFDIIFMDVHMPIVDGYEATRRIRALHDPCAKTVPIIAMTANVFREDVEKCLDAGMNSHVGKPVDFAAVKGVLGRFL
ncbi:MAG: ATP-binding protein [Defluviitaleaceae bacterium]|nr:ATP-binding protein [Defluviitaleaceae bacterium]